MSRFTPEILPLTFPQDNPFTLLSAKIIVLFFLDSKPISKSSLKKKNKTAFLKHKQFETALNSKCKNVVDELQR